MFKALVKPLNASATSPKSIKQQQTGQTAGQVLTSLGTLEDQSVSLKGEVETFLGDLKAV